VDVFLKHGVYLVEMRRCQSCQCYLFQQNSRRSELKQLYYRTTAKMPAKHFRGEAHIRCFRRLCPQMCSNKIFLFGNNFIHFMGGFKRSGSVRPGLVAWLERAFLLFFGHCTARLCPGL